MSNPPSNEGNHWRRTKTKTGCGLAMLILLALLGTAAMFTLGACAVWS